MKMLTIVGVALVIAGVLGVAGASSADYVGLNLTQPEDSRDEAEFGWVQGAACAGGAMLALAGVAVAFVAVRREREEEARDLAEEIAAHEQQEREDAAERVRESLPRQAPKNMAQGTQPENDEVATQRSQENAGTDGVPAQDPALQTPQKDASEDPLDALGKELDLDIAGKLECPDCGDAVEPGAKACSTCGAKFEGSGTEGGT